MQEVKEFPHAFEEIENTWIPMPDGIRLAARMWIPEKAHDEPVPAIFEYIPYRKRDFKRVRDEINHQYFAGYGYACIRVDIRGSGDSEGVLEDEYLEQELSDGEHIIQWLSEQSWCNGNVGIIGISWGGFNGLQLAARQPEALKAVITVCSTDDRYKDDVHYMGGCMLGDNLSWASVMFAKNSLPPDPEIVGDRWKEMWMQRLEGSGLWLEKWLRHQARDEYWAHGSICEDYSAIKIPVLAASGWADGYTNAVFRLMEHLDVPRMGLVGPWSHKYPNMGVPGPAIGFLQESIRWWDQWLKGDETGIMDEPMLRVWMQESMPPSTQYENRPGYWVGMKEWPSPIIENKNFTLNQEHLLLEQHTEKESQQASVPMSVRSPLRLGLFAGKWCSYNAPPDLPSDQREEDGGALVFQSEVLSQDLEVLGATSLDLMLEADEPVAYVAVRLSDVAPDGKATRVTYGLKNLAHRHGHANPEQLVPGKKYRVNLQLNECAHVFPQGHRFRISISTSYWPLAWTPPEVATVWLYPEESDIKLPVKIKSGITDLKFPAPQGAQPTSTVKLLRNGDEKWQVIRDLVDDKSTLWVLKDSGTQKIEEIDLQMSDCSEEKYSIINDDLSTVRGETWSKTQLERADWNIHTKTHTTLTSDKDYFYIHATLDAYEGQSRIFSKNWHEKIPRHLL
ncbi:putative CocE/NonD family hydrolase [Catalinimonas alkaloidigena]|uniref:CocE/NonD family hydrolase n=1 Tax=Catalinimonas alkaloidigena TaxID=1075417 RepID=UPI002406D8BE|nr:CocE/NonD family hydrolase [Catalinimonas alkaloidigena]MDF9798640.1 putative CocE/NonD family hydrolase [Catalinimonas alkaloidigena]